VVDMDSRPTDVPVVVGPSSFEQLFRRELRSVVALAYALSGSRLAAEEIAQEAFLAAHRRWSEVGAYDDPGAWVRKVCANHAMSFVRRRVAEARAVARLRERRVLPAELSPVDAEFWREVRRLPRRQAQVIALFYVDDRSIADIAVVLGVAEGTVKAQLHTARATLASRLSANRSEEDT
jgi:RNA polymerase sigma factor (sigma-70 family)